MILIGKLRDFPFIVDHRQQMVFSTLAHLLEGIARETNTQTQLMRDFSAKNSEQFSLSSRSELLTSMWNTVSNYYYVLQLAKADTGILNDVIQDSEFLSLSETISRIRNKRDHISSNLENLKQKGSLLPINGLAAWTFVISDGETDWNVCQQLISVDPMTKRFAVDLKKGIAGIRQQYDNLTLFAYDECFNLSRAKEILDKLCDQIADDLEAAKKVGYAEGWPKKNQLSEAEQGPFCVYFQLKLKSR